MPTEQKPLPVRQPDPVVEEWRSIVLSDRRSQPTERQAHHFDDIEVSDPCRGCEAWCCHYLVFEREMPRNLEDLDFLRFSLGFPSVEIGISETQWSLVVRTTCRHLVDNSCSVFGTDQRPLKCSYYSPLDCSYRTDLGQPRPDHLVRVRREHFDTVAQSVAFDDLGRVVAIPSLDLLRSRVEDAEGALAAAAAADHGTQ